MRDNDRWLTLFTSAESTDPLSELEALEDSAAFLRREGGSEADCNRYLTLLSKRAFVKQNREEETLEVIPKELQEVQVVQDEEDALAPPGPTKVQAWNANRSAALSDDGTRVFSAPATSFRGSTNTSSIWATSCLRSLHKSRFVVSALVLGLQQIRIRAALNPLLPRIQKVTFPTEGANGHGRRLRQ